MPPWDSEIHPITSRYGWRVASSRKRLPLFPRERMGRTGGGNKGWPLGSGPNSNDTRYADRQDEIYVNRASDRRRVALGKKRIGPETGLGWMAPAHDNIYRPVRFLRFVFYGSSLCRTVCEHMPRWKPTRVKPLEECDPRQINSRPRSLPSGPLEFHSNFRSPILEK